MSASAAVNGTPLAAPLAATAAAVGATLGLPPLAAPAPAAAQVALGRALFFERRLSVNGTLSCAMCHVPEQAFTVNELRTSVGMEGVSLRRNAPTLLNVAHVQRLFHDGRAGTLEEQALMPMLHPDEMANPDIAGVLARVARWPPYRGLFRRAFGQAQPTARGMAAALAAYQRTLLAADSPFDRWRFGGQADALTAQQRRGFELFVSLGCSSCHPVGAQDALFTDQHFHNTGVQARTDALRQREVQVQLIPGVHAVLSPDELRRVGVADAADLGRQEVTGQAADARAFRTPSLRNVALTAPYMHDGSFDTLEDVLDHYLAGGWPADPLQDPRLRPQPVGHDGRDAIVAFLRALTSPRLPDCANAAPDRRACAPARQPDRPARGP
ncbi:cytochrome-c peroxidase [Ideonella sp. A 288]|uniref:cytochrome-c peroxidase n=1 Tax=Ideonella sp. A 288 TaxID=1962181 RepID=UPI001303E816|nr:cytochrome c peroxidase [Ideonella sp. A 288]